MTKSGLSKSTRKFIRLEKARIRTQFLDLKKREEMIKELYQKLSNIKAGRTLNLAKKEAKKPIEKPKQKKHLKSEKNRTTS